AEGNVAARSRNTATPSASAIRIMARPPISDSFLTSVGWHEVARPESSKGVCTTWVHVHAFRRLRACNPTRLSAAALGTLLYTFTAHFAAAVRSSSILAHNTIDRPL